VTIERVRHWRTGERNIVFHCDAKRCAETIDTELDDFSDAVEEAKSKGWTMRQAGGEWKHYCPEEDDDSEITG
jgi:hypothetical protein